jgi:CTP synthase
VTELRGRGIQPDVIVCRSDHPISDALKQKISLLCDVPVDAVVSAVDASSIYEIPLLLHDEGLDSTVCQILNLEGPGREVDLSAWQEFVQRVSMATEVVRVGIIGKYINMPDAYLSVVESLRHAGFAHGARVELEWIQAESFIDADVSADLCNLDAIVIPGGFGERGVEGKVAAARYARENNLPCLGICLGLQVMVIDFAREVAKMEGANSGEFGDDLEFPVIALMDEQVQVINMGGTMRLGSYVAVLRPDSQVAKIYGKTTVTERHRHRYEVNNRFRQRLEDAGLGLSGTSPDGRLVEFIELPGHRFWVGTQAHPEFKSRPDNAHPLFRELVAAGLERARARDPHLFPIDAHVPS